MIKYGLISETDAGTIEKTIDLICNDYKQGEVIRTTCIGIFDGDTDRGIHEYILSKGFNHIHTAIDNAKYFEIKNPFEGCNLIIGNSAEVAYLIPNDSQDFIFVDACHAFHAAIADFFSYESKIKVGGFLALHDTGSHIKPFTGYQDIGSKDDPDMYISVRKALNKIKLLSNGLYIDIEEIISANVSIDEAMKIYNQTGIQVWNSRDTSQWQLIFDEADINDEAGGMCVFKKLY